jgi:hypothetical protein
MSIGTMANHKLSIETTQDPCYFSLDSTFKITKNNMTREYNTKGFLSMISASAAYPQSRVTIPFSNMEEFSRWLTVKHAFNPHLNISRLINKN